MSVPPSFVFFSGAFFAGCTLQLESSPVTRATKIANLMRRGRALLAASAVAPAPPQGSDAASVSVSHSIEPIASSDACVTDAAMTPQISTPTDGAAHPSEVPEGQIVANSGHQITPVGRLMLGDAATDATAVAAERVAMRHADGSDPTPAPSAEPPHWST